MHDEDSKILIEYHFYILNDRKHDSEFVHIVLAYIGGTFQTMDFPQDGIMCGLMGALINLSLQNLGILYLCILT